MEVHFNPNEDFKLIQIPLADDDIFFEANKTFEVYLVSSPGVYISPIGYVSAVILNDDLPLPGECICNGGQSCSIVAFDALQLVIDKSKVESLYAVVMSSYYTVHTSL